jgi:hypothetical protein
MTSSCRDSEIIPKVVDAGRVTTPDGQRVQIMHDGTKVMLEDTMATEGLASSKICEVTTNPRRN